jgi:hypothetical protein
MLMVKVRVAVAANICLQLTYFASRVLVVPNFSPNEFVVSNNQVPESAVLGRRPLC